MSLEQFGSDAIGIDDQNPLATRGPDRRMLVTERPGRMRLVSPKGQLSPPLKGVPVGVM